MTCLPDDSRPDRGRRLELNRYAAAARNADSKRYFWLADCLKIAGQNRAAARAREWAIEHERVAYDLLGLKGRQR